MRDIQKAIKVSVRAALLTGITIGLVVGNGSTWIESLEFWVIMLLVLSYRHYKDGKDPI